MPRELLNNNASRRLHDGRDTTLESPGVSGGLKLAAMTRCKSCGVPLTVGQELYWNADGTITRRRAPGERMVLLDSSGLDLLFARVEKLLGARVRDVVVASEARAIISEIRGDRKSPLRSLGLRSSPERDVRKFAERGRALGYGDLRVTKFNLKGNYMFCELSNPYSLLLLSGDLKGLGEGHLRVSENVSVEEISPERYFVRSFAAPSNPEEPTGPRPRARPRKPGDIEYDRCPVCEVPREISGLKWDLETGTISSPAHGLRMVILDPHRLDAIFRELESRFGIAVPFALVEAQRGYATDRLSPWLELAGREGLARWISMQGLGNLTSIDGNGQGFEARVENPELPHLLVGTLLGLYEYAKGEKAFAEWFLTESHDLALSVTRPAA